MSDHDELESSVAAWVLGALDPEEAAVIRSHVDGCPSCREVAARLRRVVGALPLAVDEVTPPPRLRERVLAAASAPPSSSPARRVQVRRRPYAVAPRSIATRIPLYAAAAAALIALLAGLVIGQAFRPAPATAPSQVARFTLAGHQAMAGAQARVIDLQADGLTLVDFRGLPQPGSGRVYEVWLIRSGSAPQPVAVFVPDGTGARVVLVDRSLSGYSVMAVTNEPGPDGSAAPTQQPQLFGNLA